MEENRGNSPVSSPNKNNSRPTIGHNRGLSIQNSLNISGLFKTDSSIRNIIPLSKLLPLLNEHRRKRKETPWVPSKLTQSNSQSDRSTLDDDARSRLTLSSSQTDRSTMEENVSDSRELLDILLKANEEKNGRKKEGKKTDSVYHLLNAIEIENSPTHERKTDIEEVQSSHLCVTYPNGDKEMIEYIPKKHILPLLESHAKKKGYELDYMFISTVNGARLNLKPQDTMYLLKYEHSLELMLEEKTFKTEFKIHGISLDDLLDKLIDVYREPNLVLALVHQTLLTYRNYCSSEELLKGIIKRFFGAPKDFGKYRACNVIVLWRQKHWFDFQKDKSKLIPILEDFSSNLGDDELKFKRYIDKACENVDHGTETSDLKQIDKSIIPFNNDFELLDIHPLELARQLTIADSELFRSIFPWEFLNQAWGKPNAKECSPTIYQFIQRFNKISFWIATQILTELDYSIRVKKLGFFIEVCVHLRKLNNFNSLLQILSALNSSPIFRLKKTWGGLSKQLKTIWTKLIAFIDFQKLKNFTCKSSPPLVPYLGDFLTELTQIEEEDNWVVVNKTKLINFRKCGMIARTLSKIQFMQQEKYWFRIVPNIQKFFDTPIVSDDQLDLHQVSLFLEPKEGEEEGEMPPCLKKYYQQPSLKISQNEVLVKKLFSVAAAKIDFSVLSIIDSLNDKQIKTDEILSMLSLHQDLIKSELARLEHDFISKTKKRKD